MALQRATAAPMGRNYMDKQVCGNWHVERWHAAKKVASKVGKLDGELVHLTVTTEKGTPVTYY